MKLLKRLFTREPVAHRAKTPTEMIALELLDNSGIILNRAQRASAETMIARAPEAFLDGRWVKVGDSGVGFVKDNKR